ncbi:MAG: DUF1800 domain-containing protein, partial [Burkholderiales bacterium]
MTQLQAAIAATRFGMGARPEDIRLAASDPRGWLKSQITPAAAQMPAGDLMSTRQVFEARLETMSMSAGDQAAGAA